MPRVVSLQQGESDRFFETHWDVWNEKVGVRWETRQFCVGVRGDNDELVGAAAFSIIGGVGELKQILVRLEYSGTGVGSLLMREFELRCRDTCHKLTLETAEYQARGFYEKHGFGVVHTRVNDRFHKTWYLMEKLIENSRDESGHEVAGSPMAERSSE